MSNIIMNLSYNITEVEKEKTIDIDKLVENVNKEHLECTGNQSDIFDDDDENELGGSERMAIRLDYETNYTVKMLRHIMDYYKLDRKKLLKTEMINKIIDFEQNYENIEIVEKRRYMWSIIDEIKDDEYLSKYIIFDG